jgi:hypothetical protein
LVLFSLCTFDMHLFSATKDPSSFYNFKFHHTISQHRVGLPTSLLYIRRLQPTNIAIKLRNLH